MKKIIFLVTIILFSWTVPVAATNSGIGAESGTYPIDYSYTDEAGQTVQGTRYITVLNNEAVEYKEYSEAMSAFDIMIGKGVFNQLSDQDLLLTAKVRAWSTKDASPIAITRVEKQPINNAEGMFEVAFYTTRGSVITITVIEVDTTILPEQSAVHAEYMSVHFMTIGILLLLLVLIPLLILLLQLFFIRRTAKQIETVLYVDEEES